MIAETVSGSSYEIDLAGKRARRLSSWHEGTGRTPRGVWREFVGMHPPSGPLLGQRMFFEWADESAGAPAAPGWVPGTMTTPVMLVCS